MPRGNKTLRCWLFGNLANGVSLAGLAVTVWLLVLVLYYPDHLFFIFGLAVVVVATDWLDGYLARSLAIESYLGKALDRLRDKVFVCSMFYFLAWYYLRTAEIGVVADSLAKALVVLLLFLELLLLLFGCLGAFRGLDIGSNRYGRQKMAVESLAIFFWLTALIADRCWRFPPLGFSLYLIDAVLLVAIYLAVRSLEGYYKRYHQPPV